ncbi:MAG: leucine-rich repeat protein, partial [Verrucomicrobia bacterium]|nr:leucine-rich repeat protein [Verrucomicrobiota bacterium]
YIEGSAFAKTSVRHAFVPKTSHNPLSIYENCSSIEEFLVSSENRFFVAVSGVLFTKDLKKLVRYPPRKADKKYVIPEKCLTIGKNAFQKVDKLTSLVIPETVKNIEGGAFSYFFYQMKQNGRRGSFSSVKTNIKLDMPVQLKDQLKERFSPEQVVFQSATNPQQNP